MLGAGDGEFFEEGRCLNTSPPPRVSTIPEALMSWWKHETFERPPARDSLEDHSVIGARSTLQSNTTLGNFLFW